MSEVLIKFETPRWRGHLARAISNKNQQALYKRIEAVLQKAIQTFPHAEGYVKNNAGNYVYHYIYKDHLGNNRLVYADLNNDGTINPANEIVEENNYYPFGLKHEGYNNLPGAGYKYKFLNKEYEDSFALNVTETDFRHYDSALGRFNVMDVLSELAPNYTPYRYGFNNPIARICNPCDK